MANRIQLRRGTAAEWTAANPVLAQGEPGVETDTGKQKFGNGVAAWAALPYASVGPQGAPGVADDASVAEQVTSGPETVAALSATILDQIEAPIADAVAPKLDAIVAETVYTNPLRPLRSVTTVRTLGTNGKPVAHFQAARRRIVIQNIGALDLLVGIASGKVTTVPTYTVTVPVGQEYYAGWTPHPHWIKSSTVGTAATARVIIEQEV